MRVPAFLLTHTAEVTPLSGTNVLGPVLGAPANRKGHFEQKATLRVDQRTTSETAGTEITMTGRLIMQLEHYVPPGSRVVVDGTTYEVAAAAKQEHPLAPSHAELWVV